MSLEVTRDIRPRHGEMVRLSPLIRRIVAPNAGPFTYTGTGTYVIGEGKVAVIDPGPADERHVAALHAALGDEQPSHILITHTHADHSPAAALLQRHHDAPGCGFGPHGECGESGEEAADREFVPDIRLRDGDVIRGDGWTIEAVHTPGHCSNHLCFALHEESALFSGDHVMGWSTSVIAPPDGDMAAYLDSLEKVRKRKEAVFWPTHGPPIRNPQRHVEALIAHRHARESAILAQLGAGVCEIPAIVAALYHDVPKGLHAAASLSVEAHLIKLIKEGRVHRDGSHYSLF